jgi:outer membrane protein assembly factor BamE (lipoprotein component of BamABCDE complex)
VILALGLVSACMVRTNLPGAVTTENVRRVRLGMSRDDVERIIGQPVGVENEDAATHGPNAEVLIYFLRLPPPVNFPML